jgi:hypothetical protein
VSVNVSQSRSPTALKPVAVYSALGGSPGVSLASPALSSESRALNDVFLVGVPVVTLAFVVALFLKELPLRTMQRQSPGAPATAESAPAEALSAGL